MAAEAARVLRMREASEAVEAVEAIEACASDADRHLWCDVRADKVVLALQSLDAAGVTDADVAPAGRVSLAVREVGRRQSGEAMLGVGDLLFTRSSGWAARMVRLGEALRDEPNLDNHVAVVHHQDAAGVWWAIEGRPGGVGYADARHYLSSRWSNDNIGQPKTDDQRAQIAAVAEGMLRTPPPTTGAASSPTR